MKKTLWLAAIAVLTAAIVWSQGWGRHRVTVRIVAPVNEAGIVPPMLVTVRVAYRDGQRESSHTVYDDVLAANTTAEISVPSADPRTFRRLEVRVLHPGFRALELESDRNPHWFAARIPDLAPEPWTLAPDYRPEPADEVESFFRDVRTRWLPAVGERDAGYQVWAYRDVLQSLVPRASFATERLHGVAMEEQRERIGRLRGDQQYLMGLMRAPDMRPIDAP